MRLHSASLAPSATTLLDEKGKAIRGLQLTLLAVLEEPEGAQIAAEAVGRVREALLVVTQQWRAHNEHLQLQQQTEESLAACRAQIGNHQAELEALANGEGFVDLADAVETATSRLALCQRQEGILQKRLAEVRSLAERGLAEALEARRQALLAEMEAERREAFEQLEQMLTAGFEPYHAASVAAAWLGSHKNPRHVFGQHFDLFKSIGAIPKKPPSGETTQRVSTGDLDPVHGKDVAHA